MKKRIFALMLAGVLALSACGNKPAEEPSAEASQETSGENTDNTEATTDTSNADSGSSSSGDKVTLKVMHRFPDEPYQSFMNKVCDQYMEANPNVEIVQTSAETGPYKERLTVLMSNDDEAPDVFFGFTGEYLNQFIREGKVLSLDKYWEEDKEWADSYFESMMPSFYVGDELYGVPFRVSVKMFFYNTKIFEEVGVTPPETWAELIEVCQKLQDAGYIPIGEGDADQWPATHYAAILNARCVPDDVRAKDYAPETGEWTDPGYLDAMNKFKELSQYFSPAVTGQKHEMGRQQFAMGQAAMMFAESVEIPYVAMAMEEGSEVDYGMFKFPVVDGATGNQETILGAPEGFSVSAATKNPDIAVDFLKYLCGQEIGKQQVEDIQWFNGCKDTVDPATADQKLVDCYNVITSAKTVANWMDNEIHAELRTVYYEDLQTFLNGDMSPEDFVKKLQDTAAKVKSEF